MKRSSIEPQMKCARSGYRDQGIGIMVIQGKISQLLYTSTDNSIITSFLNNLRNNSYD